MSITRQPPTGRQLFRTVCVGVAAAWLAAGGLLLAWCWLAGWDPAAVRDLAPVGLIAAELSVGTVLAYYPWTPAHAKSLGCRPD